MVLCGLLVSRCLERGASQSSADHKVSDLLRSLSCPHVPSFSAFKAIYCGLPVNTLSDTQTRSSVDSGITQPAALWWTQRLQGSDQAMPQVPGQRTGKGGKLTPSTPSLIVSANSMVTAFCCFSAAAQESLFVARPRNWSE